MKVRLEDAPLTEQGAWQVMLYRMATWTWWATLTFEHHTSQVRANDIARCWLRYLARDLARDHVAVFGGGGPQPGGRWHFHMMLAMPSAASSVMHEADAAWKRLDATTGYTHIERFDEFLGPGAIAYIRQHDWFAPAFACPRTGRCAHRSCERGSAPLR